MDKDISDILMKEYEKRIVFHLSAEDQSNSVSMKSGRRGRINFGHVGRKADTARRGIRRFGIERFVKTDRRMRTNVAGVYACGAGEMLLASGLSPSEVCINNILGKMRGYNGLPY